MIHAVILTLILYGTAITTAQFADMAHCQAAAKTLLAQQGTLEANCSDNGGTK